MLTPLSFQLIKYWNDRIGHICLGIHKMSEITYKSSLLIEAFMRADFYNHPVGIIQLIETHISWVVLTGDYAYKIKKNINLGFLDFSSLKNRQYYCEEELRLNQRLAEDIYLQVLPISINKNRFQLNDKGDVVEYVLKMKQFSSSGELDNLLDTGQLKNSHIDSFAKLISGFHRLVERSTKDDHYGLANYIYKPINENFEQIRKFSSQTQLSETLSKLEVWSQSNFKHLQLIFKQRKEQGYVRECHGDMHLHNMTWFNNKPVLFDCIEFNPDLRWIDVISDIAFFLMDLQKKNRLNFSQRFLDKYLQITGDYTGLRLLVFYLVYRALVRAKVEAITAAQADISRKHKSAAESSLCDYVKLAVTYTQVNTRRLIITHGFSASGKSTVSQQLLENSKLIRIRSDVERKRIFNYLNKNDSMSDVGTDIYSLNATQKTYEKLLALSSQILDSGFSVLVDAAFLKYEQRCKFQNLAQEKNINYVILDVTASDDVLRQRIQNRKHDISDADLNVLEDQLKSSEIFRNQELTHVITVDTEKYLNIEILIDQINKLT